MLAKWVICASFLSVSVELGKPQSCGESMDLHNLLVMTSPGRVENSVVIAACRAGARGVLDWEYIVSPQRVQSALTQAVEQARGPFGVKLGPGSGALLPMLEDVSSDHLAWVVLAGGDHAALSDWTIRFQNRGVQVFVEAVSVEEMHLAQKLGADGLILKGQEAGGRVGDETTFVLLQRWRAEFGPDAEFPLPAFVQGGIGLNTAAAVIAAGASGVVLESQLLMTKESALKKSARTWLSAFDGSQTVCLGARLGETYRIQKRPQSPVIETLEAEEIRLESSELSPEEKLAAWREAVAKQIQNQAPDEVIFLGQSGCFANDLAEQYVTVSGVLQAVADRVSRNLKFARELQPLAEGSEFAKRHGIKYPIFQGPMTRVSDTADFADSVSQAGGLPFLALALLRKKATETLLEETQKQLGDRSWGVGLLGFLPPEIRKEQVAAIRKFKPPFALIAGGRPDQAKELEDQGIPTYLHVPSPGLLKMFLKDGARRFIFEGRECGGHVGPRGSFVLWETMCELLLDHIQSGGKADELHIVFAGGIHDALSSAAVAAMAAPLVEKGVAIGALMGTAYLFTQEAVAGGAIVPRFQEEALQSANTVLLETAPGHAIRCINTPYFQDFHREKLKLKKEGKTNEEITQALEWMNIGRLRVASKGTDRVKNESGQSELAELPSDEQYSRGMYMIGQIAVMHDKVITMEELHRQVSEASREVLEQSAMEILETPSAEKPCDIAVIGMSCFYPKAKNLREYWEHILDRVDAVTEVPATHWDWRLYYDADPRAKDKIVSKWGGFMDDIPFDPLKYGITPASVKAIEPLQLLLLEAVQHTLEDAGYTKRPFNREKTSAILGIGGGGGPVAVAYGFRCCLPLLNTVPGVEIPTEKILENSGDAFPEWTEDSFPGILSNVAVGRVANRFNFGGANLAIDAACASSLAAVYSCVRELEMGTSDVAIAMGADTVMTPYAYTAFSKTHALSQRGRCSPFDAAGDGIVLSEGIGVVMLKRLADAERDGDKIYSVIKGVGASSDGREKGLTAPNLAGQMRALRRAYSQANLSPSKVELIEAHGTGTVVGDHTEARALIEVFKEFDAKPQSCAIGSVKSMIGHTKCAAGIGGMIKTALALHHKVLPPTLVDQPNPRINFEDSPLYLNSEPRPWVHGADHPRYAGVSAFGFGGTNYHIVMEEYTGNYQDRTPPAKRNWSSELYLWRRATREELAKDVNRVHQVLQGEHEPDLARLALTLCRANSEDTALPTLAVVASSVADLTQKLGDAIALLESDAKEKTDPRGIYFHQSPKEKAGKVAFLFPGQGSQYPNMLAQAGTTFPEIREAFDKATRQLMGKWDRPLGRFVYPASTFTPEAEKQTREMLSQTDVAQPALGAAGMGMFRLMESLGVKPDFLAGHSYGEYAALCAAGVLEEDDLYRVSYERGRLINEAAGENQGGMVAVDADAKTVAQAIDGLEGVWLANLNSPSQTVVSGSEDGLEALLKRLPEHKLRGRRIPVACGFHSPLVSDAAKPLAQVLSETEFSEPNAVVYSNTLGEAYPMEPEKIGNTLSDHLASSVQFQPQIEAMAKAGATVFLEVGPQGVLTGLVHQILADQPHLAVATDVKGRDGLVQLQHALAQLLVHGVPVRLERLHEDRNLTPYSLTTLEQDVRPAELSRTTWMVNGIRNRPLNAPEPFLLGQTPTMQSNSHASAEEAAPAPSPASNGSPSSRLPNPPAQSSPAMPNTSTQTVSQNPASAQAAAPQNGHAAQAQPAPQAPTQTPTTVHPTMPAASGDEVTQVMHGFQNLMARFLDTQRSVMTSYLQGGTGSMESAMPASLPAPVQSPMPAPMPTPMPNAAPANGATAHHNGNGNGAHTNGNAAANGASNRSANGNGTHKGSANGTTNGAIAKPEPAAEPALEPLVAEESGTPAVTREWLTTELLELVSVRTGYPKDMLRMDLDLEGELGIDSIKRVEILGSLAESLGTDDEMDSPLDLEQLTTLRTLGGILDYLEEALSETEVEPAPVQNGKPTNGELAKTNGAVSHVEPSDDQLKVQRGLVKVVELPTPSGASMLIPSGSVLLTDDGRGLADEIAGRLADFEINTITINPNEVDCTDAKAVAELLATLKEEHGAIGGLIHLSPLAKVNAEETWGERAHRDVKSLYLLAQALEADLNQAGEEGGSFLLAPTLMGGELAFGDAPLPESFLPGHGGILGFTKCLGSEWPNVLVRGVDFDEVSSPERFAALLLGELSDAEGPLEVGYVAGQRVTWDPVNLELDQDQTGVVLDENSTILITGGARGITARIALELAERHQPNLVLVGRSEEPQPESADTAKLTEQAEIKAVLIARLEKSGDAFTPAKVESLYQRLMSDREILANLAAIKNAGAKVSYRSVDVRDETQMVSLIEELKAQGGIDGVIHGAGIIDDKLVRDKTPESFDRVFGTKVDSASILARHLDPKTLKFCAFFASIASRYGNRGQSDYAAANEVLSKLAHQLDRQWPGRVFAVAWGPWAEVGMVSHLEKHLVKRGLKLIPPDQGAARFADELAHGQKGDSEVLIAGGEEHEIRPKRSGQASGQLATT